VRGAERPPLSKEDTDMPEPSCNCLTACPRCDITVVNPDRAEMHRLLRVANRDARQGREASKKS
jgi:hypothetical protein